MNQESYSIHVSDFEEYQFAFMTFRHAFAWLRQTLVSMTGFAYPSGYALINPYTRTISNIKAGSGEEYALADDLRNVTMCIYIDNYEGSEANIIGWKGIPNKEILEETFNIKFNEKSMESLGGFPETLSLST